MSQDREFDTYLQGKTDLSQSYADLPPVELPDHLDAAILAEAHRAVKSRPAARPKRRWSIPLSMVASLIVAVMVGLQLPHMLKDAALPLPQEEQRIAAAAMDKSTGGLASPAPDERREIQPMARAKSESTRGEPAPMAAQAEAAAKPDAPVLVAPKETQTAGTQESGATSVVALPPVAAPSPAPVRAAKRPDLRERAIADNGGMAASKEKKASSRAEDAVGDFSEQRAPAAAGASVPQPAQPDSSVQTFNEDTNEASLSPEDWLARIQRLKQQGKLDEARKDLAAFKKRYPDYRVPEALELR